MIHTRSSKNRRPAPGSATGPGRPTGLFVVWKAYQRRSELLAPLIGAQRLFIPHRFRSKYLRPIDYVIKFFVTTAKIARDRPRFVVLQSPPHYAALPALLTGVPYIIDAHNGVFQSGWRDYPLASYVMRKAKAILVHNEEILAEARRMLPDAQYYVIGDPIVQIRPAAPTPRNERQVLFICSFGEDEPISAIIDVIEALPDYRFVITADVRRLAPQHRRRLARCGNLELTGFLSTEDYHAVLCRSAAAVALTENEATQQSGACEALSSDTPLITSRSSLSESLFGEWAILVENEAPPIIRAIRSLSGQPLDLSRYRSAWNEEIDVGLRRLRLELQRGEAAVSAA